VKIWTREVDDRRREEQVFRTRMAWALSPMRLVPKVR